MVCILHIDNAERNKGDTSRLKSQSIAACTFLPVIPGRPDDSGQAWSKAQRAQHAGILNDGNDQAQQHHQESPRHPPCHLLCSPSNCSGVDAELHRKGVTPSQRKSKACVSFTATHDYTSQEWTVSCALMHNCSIETL